MTLSFLCELRVLRGEKYGCEKEAYSFKAPERSINFYSFNFAVAEFSHGFGGHRQPVF